MERRDARHAGPSSVSMRQGAAKCQMSFLFLATARLVNSFMPQLSDAIYRKSRCIRRRASPKEGEQRRDQANQTPTMTPFEHVSVAIGLRTKQCLEEKCPLDPCSRLGAFTFTPNDAGLSPGATTAGQTTGAALASPDGTRVLPNGNSESRWRH